MLWAREAAIYPIQQVTSTKVQIGRKRGKWRGGNREGPRSGDPRRLGMGRYVSSIALTSFFSKNDRPALEGI